MSPVQSDALLLQSHVYGTVHIGISKEYIYLRVEKKNK